MASRNPLSADSLVEYMEKSLSKDHDENSPVLKDPYAAVGLFCHACMLAVGFKLIGLGEDHKLGMVLASVPARYDADYSQKHNQNLTMFNHSRRSGTLLPPLPSATHTPNPRWNT